MRFDGLVKRLAGPAVGGHFGRDERGARTWDERGSGRRAQKCAPTASARNYAARVSEAGPVLYDPVELRRRIVVCFSVGELRALAESLGVGGITWERGIHEAAREMVRQCERYAGLPALVARLREARPLVEWPEPVAGPGATEATAPPAAPSFTPLSASPGRLGPVEPAPPASSPALVDPYSAPPGSTRPPAPWPGVTPVIQAPARPGGIDPRIFVAVAGLMVLAAILAYLAGRASSATPTADATGASDTAAPPSSKGDGPAALAAGALGRSFASMARVCELPSSAGTSSLVFRRIYERCGPLAPPQRSYAPPLPVVTAPTSADPAPPAEAPPPRGKRGGGRGGDPTPGDAPSGSGGCMGTCNAQHAACRSHCGAEPTESSAYDGFQRCLGRCLSDASRCRLGCR